MKYRSNQDRIPLRLMNECGFCHRRGLKPGLLDLEFPQDLRTRASFSAMAPLLPLDGNGFCQECASTLGGVGDQRT